MNISKNKIYVNNMNESLKGASEIISAFFEKAGRTSKFPDGTTVYTPPKMFNTRGKGRGFDGDYEYSKSFINFNLKMLKNGKTRYYIPDEQKIYNYTTQRLENRSAYYKKTD